MTIPRQLAPTVGLAHGGVEFLEGSHLGFEEFATQDKDLDSFGPRETSSGNNPTCCLWLGLIMLMRESPHKSALL